MSKDRPKTITLFEDERGQSFSLEALISVTLLITVIFFVIPSISTINYANQVNDVRQQEQAEDEIQTIISKHAHQGTLKASLLRFSHDSPHERFLMDNISAPPDNNITQIVNLKGAESPLGEDIREYEKEHNAVVNVYLIPGDADAGREAYIGQTHPGNTIAVATEQVVLYKTDRLESPRGAHAHTANYALSPSEGDNVQLQTIDDDDAYPIKQLDSTPADSQVYNVVTVKVLVFKQAKAL